MLTRAERDTLGRVFAAEIEGRLYQGRAKLLPALAEQGMVEQVSQVLGGRFPVVVKGWALTHRGRYLYCQSCGSVKLTD